MKIGWKEEARWKGIGGKIGGGGGGRDGGKGDE